MRKLRVLSAVAVVLLTATAGCGYETLQQRVARRAAAGVRHELNGAQIGVKGALRDVQETGRTSPAGIKKIMVLYFGWHGPEDGARQGIFALRSLPDGTVNVDIVLSSTASDGGGGTYTQTSAAACVRFIGKPGPDPVVTFTDVPCPPGVAATNVTVIRVGK